MMRFKRKTIVRQDRLGTQAGQTDKRQQTLNHRLLFCLCLSESAIGLFIFILVVSLLRFWEACLLQRMPGFIIDGDDVTLKTLDAYLDVKEGKIAATTSNLRLSQLVPSSPAASLDASTVRTTQEETCHCNETVSSLREKRRLSRELSHDRHS